MRTPELLAERKVEHQKRSSRPAQRINGRSFKHVRQFKYERHTRVFDGYGDNLRDVGSVIRELEKQRGKGEHIEIRTPNQYGRLDRTTGKVMACYSLTWYTRKDLGPKNA